MSAPNLRTKKARTPTAASAGTAHSSPAKGARSPTTAKSPQKTAKIPPPVEAAPSPATMARDATVEAARVASANGGKTRTTDSSTSRISAQSDGSSYVAVSPLTTPGNSYVPLQRRKVPTAPEVNEAATSAAPVHGDSERPNTDEAGPRTKRPAVAKPTAAASGASGGSPAKAANHGRQPAAKASSSVGIPLSRGQLPSPGTATAASGSSAAAAARHQLRRQLSSNTHTLTVLAPASTGSGTATEAAGSAKELPLSASGHHKADSGVRPAVRNSTSYYDQLEQMEGVMDYVDSITQALARRTRSLPPPDALTSFRATIVPSTRRATAPSATSRGFSSIEEEEAHYSLLSSLHDASSTLLSAFSKLEYVQMSKNEELQELERTTLQACAKVLVVVEKIDRKFTTHEDADLRIAFKQRRNVVLACQEFLDSLTQTAQQIVLLRKLTATHDLHRVRETLEELKEVMQRRVVTASTPLSAQYQALMLTGPFFEWLEQRWLPAMRAWRKIVVEARQTAASGDVDGAIAASQQELLSAPALREILRPGETLTDLHHKEVEGPLSELAKTFDKKRAVMDQLQAAIEEPTLAGLGRAIQASQDFTKAQGRTQQQQQQQQRQQLSPEEEQCLQRAQQLLCDLQETEVVRRAMESALQLGAGSSLTLFQPLQRANELIFRLELAQSPVQADRVVRASKAAMVKLTALLPTGEEQQHALDSVSNIAAGSSGSPQPILAELLPPTVTVHDLCIAHIPSKVWPVEVSTTYQQLCQLLADISMRELVRRDLEKALIGDRAPIHTGGSAPPTAGGLTNSSLRDGGSSLNTTYREEDEEVGSNGRRTTMTANSSATSPHAGSSVTTVMFTIHELEELQNRVKRAEEMGLSGALVEQAKARIAQLNTIRLKVHFDAQTRIIPIPDPDNTSFDKVYERLYTDCVEQQTVQKVASDQRLRIRYEDLDGDFITILNDEDWQMMLSERAPRGQRAGIKIEVYCDFLILPDTPRIGTGNGAGGAVAAAAVAASWQEDSGDGGVLRQSSDRNVAAVNRSFEKEARGFARTNSGARAVTPTRQGRAGAGGGRTIQPTMNNAARLRAASRTRYASPTLTVENLTRSQSGYGRLSPRGGGNAAADAPRGEKGKQKSRDQQRQPRQRQPPALVQDAGAADPWDDARDTGVDADKDAVRVANHTPPVQVVKLNLDGCRRWIDDEESRVSPLELQTVASVSTVQTNRLAPSSEGVDAAARGVRHNNVGSGRSVLERATASRVGPATTAPPSRFTATNCSKASPVKQPLAPEPQPQPQPQPQQPLRPLTAKRWDASGDGIFDDIHTICSESTRVRDSRSRGATSTGAVPALQEEATNSEKENEYALPAARSPYYGKSARALAAALPPRPDPHRRTGTPNRPRGQRGAGPFHATDEEAATHRDPSSIFDEMQQMREQNLMAMRTPTPRRAWH